MCMLIIMVLHILKSSVGSIVVYYILCWSIHHTCTEMLAVSAYQ